MDNNASVTLSSEHFAAVNLPAGILSILLNIFFIYCMVFQQREQEQLKQPLNILQGILIGCHIMISVCILFKACFNVFQPNWKYIMYMFSNWGVYFMMISVSSSFWQNVFYYCQIIPAKSHFIWLKKNICVFIYCALVINGIFYVFEMSLISVVLLILQDCSTDNGTSLICATLDNILGVFVMWSVVYYMTLGILILNLCGMSTSSCATVIFLWRHLKNMEESNALSSPRFQKQIMMTIRSIAIHSLINFICSMGVIIVLFFEMFSSLNFDENQNLLSTMVSFYALGTTVTLGFAQSMYRQQVVYAWKKMFPMF